MAIRSCLSFCDVNRVQQSSSSSKARCASNFDLSKTKRNNNNTLSQTGNSVTHKNHTVFFDRHLDTVILFSSLVRCCILSKCCYCCFIYGVSRRPCYEYGSRLVNVSLSRKQPYVLHAWSFVFEKFLVSLLYIL